jgi:hypothetical protein
LCLKSAPHKALRDFHYNRSQSESTHIKSLASIEPSMCWFDNGCIITAAHGRRTFMALTDIKVHSAKPQEMEYTLADGYGMFLLIHPNGSKYRRFRFRFGGVSST